MSSFTSCWTFTPEGMDGEVEVEATINCISGSDPGQTAGPPDAWYPPEGPEWEIVHFDVLSIAGAEVIRSTGGWWWLQEQFESRFEHEISYQVDAQFSYPEEDYDPYDGGLS